MKPSRVKQSAIVALLFVSFPLSAQINLNRFSSRDVQRGIGMSTHVDTLLLDTRVADGLATTTITMSLRPGEPYHTTDLQNADLDSIEITAWFSLPADFVAKNMYLWVDGERQTAYIQDKTLARDQYQSIVGVRLDPALLETWGNGSYSLRIFPATCMEHRKIAIEFQHTFDDDSPGLITANIPVAMDSSSYYYRHDTLRIGYLEASVRSADGYAYAVTIPGLGHADALPGIPTTLRGRDIHWLGEPIISRRDPSGRNEFYWTATDKDHNRTAGFATVIAESTVTLEPEPTTRIVVLDVRQRYWDRDTYYRTRRDGDTLSNHYPAVDIWNRARKFAVLALQNYVGKDNRFNLVIAGPQPQLLFPTPVQPTAEHMRKAYRAILSATPDPAASTEDALTAALAQDNNSAVVLISDLYQPTDYYVQTNGTYGLSDNGAAYDSLLNRLERLVESAKDVLFTIGDEWALDRIARSSGGYRLAYLRWNYWLTFEPVAGSTDGSVIGILPPLFSGRPCWSGGVNIQSVSARGLTDIVWTSSNTYGGWWFWEGAMRKSAQTLGKSSTTYSPSVRFYAAGKLAQRWLRRQRVRVTVDGTLNGLGFTAHFDGTVGATTGDTGAVQWAYLASEQLAAQDWRGNADAIKALGMEYHIVTRQTSLLALEPSMELWKDTTAQQGQNRESDAAPVTMTSRSDVSTLGGTQGVSLDDVSLEDLIAQVAGVTMPAARPATRTTVRAAGATIHIALANPMNRKGLVGELYDMAGRLIAREKWTAAGTTRLTWNLSRHEELGSAPYVLRLRTGDATKTFNIVLTY